MSKLYFIFYLGILYVGVEGKSALRDEILQSSISLPDSDVLAYNAMAVPTQTQRYLNKIGDVLIDDRFCNSFSSIVGSVPCLPCGPFGLRQRTELGGHFSHLSSGCPTFPFTRQHSNLDEQDDDDHCVHFLTT